MSHKTSNGGSKEFMTEKAIELRTFRVKMFCGCGGEMKPTGMMLASCPAQYPHQCVLCNKRQNYKTTYPHLEYKDVANE
jgi:hypothetical protein